MTILSKTALAAILTAGLSFGAANAAGTTAADTGQTQPKLGVAAGQGTERSGAHAYDGDHSAKNMPREEQLGYHVVTGKVAALDKSEGTITLSTDEGKQTIWFPERSLKEVEKGDKLRVYMAFEKDQDGTTASNEPDTEARPQTVGDAS